MRCSDDIKVLFYSEVSVWQSEAAVYELFSIMVHSGGSSGGHYYAYIKCVFILFSLLRPQLSVIKSTSLLVMFHIRCWLIAYWWVAWLTDPQLLFSLSVCVAYQPLIEIVSIVKIFFQNCCLFTCKFNFYSSAIKIHHAVLAVICINSVWRLSMIVCAIAVIVVPVD